MVFLAYSMMPLRSWVAALFGFLLCAAHVAVTAVLATDFPHLRWQQVSQKLYLFTSEVLNLSIFCLCYMRQNNFRHTYGKVNFPQLY